MLSLSREQSDAPLLLLLSLPPLPVAGSLYEAVGLLLAEPTDVLADYNTVPQRDGQWLHEEFRSLSG